MNAKAKMVIRAAKAVGTKQINNEQTIYLRQGLRSLMSAIGYLSERGLGRGSVAGSIYKAADLYKLDKRIRDLMMVMQNMPESDDRQWVFARLQLARRSIRSVIENLQSDNATTASGKLVRAQHDLKDAKLRLT